MKSKKSRGTLRAVIAGFILTLIVCSFFLFSGIALQNTITAMYGSDQKVLDIRAAEETPAFHVTFLRTDYLVELTAANQAAQLLQQLYPAVPAPVRVVVYLLEGIREGVEFLIPAA